MEIAKALVLAGRGHDRSPRPGGSAAAWPSTEPWQMFPVANRPIFFHNLEALAGAGVLEARIVTDRAGADVLCAAAGDGSDWGLKLEYEIRQAGSGLHAALAAARCFLGDEPVLVQHGDALLRDRLHPHVARFARDGLDAVSLRLVGPGPPAEAGYLLSPMAIDLLLNAPWSEAGLLSRVQARGGRVRVQNVDGVLAWHGDLQALLESNRALLQDISPAIPDAGLPGCRVQGAVAVDPTASVRDSTLRGPLVIGARATVEQAYVGPYTSIGPGAVVEGSEIEYSIVLEDAHLRFVGSRLESSVIGRGARVSRAFRMPSAVQLSIGDGARVMLA